MGKKKMKWETSDFDFIIFKIKIILDIIKIRLDIIKIRLHN